MKYGVIKENHLFVKTYAKGKKAIGRYVMLFVLEDRHAHLLKKRHPLKKKVNRFGVSVSKKVGGAVLRNRTKRIIREAYRLLNSENQLVTGKLIVIKARETAVGKKTQDILSELRYLAKKLSLFEKEDKPCGLK